MLLGNESYFTVEVRNITKLVDLDGSASVSALLKRNNRS